MDNTPSSSDFDSAYENYKAPWVIGEPQQAIVELGLRRGQRVKLPAWLARIRRV